MTQILVVDDTPTVRESIRATLEAEGYVVRTASDGLRALEALAEHLPDLILLDFSMPGMNGIEFFRAALQKYHRTLPPVVLMSGDHFYEETLLRAGFKGFLLKPFDIDKLLGIVQHHTLSSEA